LIFFAISPADATPLSDYFAAMPQLFAAIIDASFFIDDTELLPAIPLCAFARYAFFERQPPRHSDIFAIIFA
jgi:hypothetical protein